MAFLWIPNQPIVPPQLANCCSSQGVESRGHLIDIEDIVQVQYQVYPCDDAVALTLGASSPVTWISASGLICGTGGGTYTAGYNNVGYNRYFQVTLEVPLFTSGELTFTIGGEGFPIQAPGTYVFYSSAPPSGTVSVFISGSFTGCFSPTIQILPILIDYKVVLYDAENMGVHTFSNPVFNDQWMTFNMNMADVPGFATGCYSFGLLDPCVNTCNQNYLPGQNFEVIGVDVNHWTNITSPALWQVAIAGQATIDATANAGYTYMNDVNLCLGSYKVSVLVTQASATEIFRISLGSTFLTTSSPGLLTGILTATVASGLQDQIGFTGTFTTPAGGFIAVEQFTITRIASQSVADQKSQLYNVINASEFEECLLKVSGCSQGEALGFNFNYQGGVFAPFIRIEGVVEGPQYKVDGTIFQYKSGKTEAVYWDRRKTRSLIIDMAKEYVHDFLSIALGFDNLFVNGVKISPVDAEYPELNWDTTQAGASVVIPIQSQTQKLTKVRCSTVTNTCVPITQEDDYKIFEDGNKFLYEDFYEFIFNG